MLVLESIKMVNGASWLVRRACRLNMTARGIHMSTRLQEKRYSSKHEWAELQSDKSIKIGISQYAADALGDVVYASLPEPGDEINADSECGALESVKAASEIYSPLPGTVTEKNDRVEEKPALINTSPEQDGWLFRITVEDSSMFDKLMNKASYQKFLESQTDDID
eukprot:TRINITY_DN52150_c0_g1_i1.p1 TRINITY_DN52150_c0_g1~~TRINITY_DN52150_c0_g1_i1.p1  ORF type:complete len:166 (-),score=11.83 TRINITY_DN52150_c0_g1_i1:43-540(-)